MGEFTITGGADGAPSGTSALTTQVAGKHYKGMAIQPIVFCQKNELNACETHAIGYIARHKQKGGAQDIRKAIHMLEILLELEYSDNVVMEDCKVVGDKPWLAQPKQKGTFD